MNIQAPRTKPLSPEKRKLAELRTEIKTGNKVIQDIEQLKESSLPELKTLAERKSLLVGEIEALKNKKLAEQETLDEIIEKQTTFVNSIQREIEKEKTTLSEVRKVLKQTIDEMDNLLTVSRELKNFINQESDARIRYLEARSKLDITEQERNQILTQVDKEKKELTDKQKNLEGIKTCVTELYGKLAMYVMTAQDTIEYVNEHLKQTGTPIVFGLPQGEMIEVDLDNFNELK